MATLTALNPEIFLTAAIVLLAWFAAGRGWKWLGWWERPLARLARRKRLAIAIAALIPLLLRAALLLRFPVPAPRVHDEFTFLLAADTLVHGRMANPTPELWPQFESFHMLMRPTYASAFPVAPAIAMALGEVLGNPWIGVWLSGAAMCAAVCWMLQSAVRPRWALLGTLLLILRLAVSSYWMNRYWGGFVAATGGALALGAMLRLWKAPGARDAAILGVGLAIMANSRPFEGAVLGGALVLALLAWGKPGTLRAVALPLGIVLAISGAAMGYYFAQITGKPWVVPYVLYRETMTMARHFVWQQPRPQPLYNSRAMRDFYVVWEMGCVDAARHLLPDLFRKVSGYWRFYLGPLLTLGLLALPAVWRDRRARILLAMAAAFWLALMGEVWHNLHYAAPVTGLMFLIVVLGLRYVRAWGEFGLALVRLIPMAVALMFGIQVMADRADGKLEGSWRWPPAGNVVRAGIVDSLCAQGGKHLILVRYSWDHQEGDEWVFNGADLENAPVLWARELDRASNASTLRHFAGRRIWLLEPDKLPIHLVAYQDATPVAMQFVQIGAPGIASIHSADEVRRRMAGFENARVSCDIWDFRFTEATGVASPDPASPDSCFGAAGRASPVSFDEWFAWVLRQK